MRALVVSVCLLLLAAMGLFILAADYLFGATAYPWFLLAAATSALGVGWFGKSLLRSRPVWVGGVALACSVLVFRFVDLSPVKPFRCFYLGLDLGESEASMLEDLDRYFPVDGRFARPDVSQGSTDKIRTLTLDPNDGRYDSEFIYVFLEDGRVSGMSYAGD